MIHVVDLYFGLFAGFDWESVANGGHVVDVGGGVGTVSMRLASAYPDMNIVVQDREQVVKEGLKVFHSKEGVLKIII